MDPGDPLTNPIFKTIDAHEQDMVVWEHCPHTLSWCNILFHATLKSIAHDLKDK